MRKATRILLSHRPQSNLVSVIPVDLNGAKLNYCYQNAFALANSNQNDMCVVSGWLVGEFWNEHGTAIIPHYWVYNEKSKKYLDPTPKNPNDFQMYEYVIDIDIFRYARKNTTLPFPMRILEDGKVQVRQANGIFIDISKVDVEELYSMCEA